MKLGFLAKFKTLEPSPLPIQVPKEECENESFNWPMFIWILIKSLLISTVIIVFVFLAAHFFAQVELERIQAKEKELTTAEKLINCLNELDTCKAIFNVYNVNAILRTLRTNFDEYSQSEKTDKMLHALWMNMQACNDSKCLRNYWSLSENNIHVAFTIAKHFIKGSPKAIEYINTNHELFFI